MRIFGRKANQQSTTPSTPDVPPELQPYFGRPSLGTRLRRIGMFALPVIAALALIAALIAGGMWLKHRSDENNKVATNQSTSQKPAIDSNQNQGTNQSQPGASQPATTTPGSASSTDNSASQQSSSSTQQSVANNQAASPANIPNTGPDASMYLLALITAGIATVAAYVRQLKTIHR